MSSSDQQYPYGQQQQPYNPYTEPHPGQAPGAGPYPQEPGPGHQEGADAAQTWEGETWDTHYQPVVPPAGLVPPAGPVTPTALPPERAGGYLPPAQDPYQQAPYPQQQQAPYAPQQQQAQQQVQAQHQAQQQVQHQVQPQHQAQAPYAQAQPQAPFAQAQQHAPYAPPTPQQGARPLPPEAPAAPHEPYGSAPYDSVPYDEAAHDAAPYSDAPAETPAAVTPDGYSAPTVGGNARVTDAQRARAEGRSPIIAPGIQPAVLTAGLGVLLAAGAAVGSYGLLVPLVLLQAVTAAGWFRLNGMWPARQGIALAFAGGLAADAVLLGVGRENAPAAILGTLGVWVLIILVLQLRSHAGADERMQGLMATVASAALAILAAGYLAASDDAVVVGGIAVAVAAVARALPLPAVASVVLSLLAAAGAGVAVGGFTDLDSGAALLGLAAGGLALVGLRVASYDYPSRFVHFTAGVALPLTAAAPAVYLIGRVLA
ncbi:hypothetical protein [Streptomyces sp. NPDC020965]|uniref:hypothetical protein n=1 Tax=Streptomyces sp. NPDC020965 TaxID=3365105 RepID=UPI0037BDD2D9